MRPRTLLILVVLGVVAVADGWYFGTATTPTASHAVDAGKLMFPDLASKLQQATRIEIVHQGKPTDIVLQNGVWGVADRGGYPVQDSKLRGMLTALTELRLVEPRTADPANYSRLGVEDPNAKDSNANLLRVLDAKGGKLVEVIVGHRRVRTQGNVPDQVYVRRPDDKQSWLAEGGLEVDADPQLWLDRDIMNIGHDRIAKVESTHGDQTLVFARTADKLALTEPADHPKLDDYRVEDVARALELLSFQDVQPAKDAAAQQEVGQAVFTTTDGLAVTATLFHAGKDVWAQFDATGADKTKDEAAKLEKRVNGWRYQIGSWKEKALAPSLVDLKAEDKSSGAAGADAAPASAEGGSDTGHAPAATSGDVAAPNSGAGAAPAKP